MDWEALVAEIIDFKTGNLTAEQAFELTKEMNELVILGYDKDGNDSMIFANVTLEGVLWLLEKAKQKVLDYK